MGEDSIRCLNTASEQSEPQLHSLSEQKPRRMRAERCEQQRSKGTRYMPICPQSALPTAGAQDTAQALTDRWERPVESPQQHQCKGTSRQGEKQSMILQLASATCCTDY
ncbi:hypothetical protein KIL84_013163 [Mauremys mutica]|uniref:Uncharacterized protein n=1 Tax=Mauremys mutica TaxID=74926 RepID=A0A9D3WXJ9_9SAUR|nr:hypothetical protein KIL84_013163 [Mauremys mutica]